MKKYYLLSLIVHIIMLVFISTFGTGNGDNSDQGDGTGKYNKDGLGKYAGDSKTIIPKTVEIEIVTLPKDGKGKNKKRSKKSKGVIDCKDNQWYGGIGVEIDPGSGVILKVIEGYPAFKAGIEQLDTIIGKIEDITGPVGSKLTLDVKKRDEVYRSYVLIREKVCVKQ